MSLKITHCLGKKSFSKEVQQEASFLLSNKRGDYLWLAGEPTSRYQGWFFAPAGCAGQKIFKVIENIKIVGGSSVNGVTNNFFEAQRQRGDLTETFFLPFFSALVYELSQPAWLEIVLDIKESYNNQTEGRSYDIFTENGLTIVRYTCWGQEPSTIFLAVKTEGEMVKTSQWLKREYSFDQQRNSPPFERYVFSALKINSDKIVFAAAEDKDEAMQQAEYVFENISFLKEERKKKVRDIIRGKIFRSRLKEGELALAYYCALNSLNNLVVATSRINGIRAGLPWFFQFWLRDETMSLPIFAEFNSQQAKKIFERELEILLSGHNLFRTDSLYWIFRSVAVLLKKRKFSLKERKKIRQCLNRTIALLLEHHTKDGLALNYSRGTWMDTIDRGEAAIEIQALRLSLFHLARRFNPDLGKQLFYLKLEKELKKKVREKFWNGQMLADSFQSEKGEADFTCRSNIFLAAYIYPKLLSKTEWRQCFENALNKLWLGWGGIATLDKENPSFHNQHTGELSASYHQGDSWFFINNLAALVLFNVDQKRFQMYINKILERSSEEILWQGMVGHHCELSSANYFSSQGCLSQAWSAALFVELFLKTVVYPNQ